MSVKCFLILSFLLIPLSNSYAFGSRSWPWPRREPAPVPETPIETSTQEIGQKIDSYYSNTELLYGRDPASHSAERCAGNESEDTFIETINKGVKSALVPRRQELDYIATASYDPYNIYNSNQAYNSVSLISHAMCNVDQSSLATILSTSSRAAQMPSSKGIQDMNTFANRYNDLRKKYLEGDSSAKEKVGALWTRFMGCLSYIESLGDADSPRSDNLADQYAPADYSRPEGVNFYYDRGQPIESALNIGLFQFAPGSGGNIQGCIRNWNKQYPSCQISQKSSTAEMIRILGDSQQVFNAFCGSNMVLNTFFVQANTKNSYRVHPANINKNGSLKSASERCVSLHVRTGRSYNHFGPFHNSTGSNLDKLMRCAVAE
jgi:hypothetical protein